MAEKFRVDPAGDLVLPGHPLAGALTPATRGRNVKPTIDMRQAIP